MPVFAEEDSQPSTIAATLAAPFGSLSLESLLSFWPAAELPYTFKYGEGDEEYTYSPDDYGGPVMVLLNSKEAEAASKNVSEHAWAGLSSCSDVLA